MTCAAPALTDETTSAVATGNGAALELGASTDDADDEDGSGAMDGGVGAAGGERMSIPATSCSVRWRSDSRPAATLAVTPFPVTTVVKRGVGAKVEGDAGVSEDEGAARELEGALGAGAGIPPSWARAGPARRRARATERIAGLVGSVGRSGRKRGTASVLPATVQSPSSHSCDCLASCRRVLDRRKRVALHHRGVSLDELERVRGQRKTSRCTDLLRILATSRRALHSHRTRSPPDSVDVLDRMFRASWRTVGVPDVGGRAREKKTTRRDG